jgi:hypothetical protein
MRAAALGVAGAFGGAATATLGTAVGYGYMLGWEVTSRPCPHCDHHQSGPIDASLPVVDRRLQHLHRDVKTQAGAAGAPSGTAGITSVDEAHRRRAYDGLAESFDEELEWHETLTGIKLMRWLMMRQARGETLEVAAG